MSEAHTDWLPVSELFGPVYQGEGPYAGRRVSFLRLMGCNLSCSWCDTPYTWDTSRFDLAAETTKMRPDLIVKALGKHRTDTLVLSGGEPMIHHRKPAFLTLMAMWPGAVHVETNGTVRPDDWAATRVSHWSVSAKLANGGDPGKRRIVPRALAWYAARPDAVFKFVAATPGDVDEAADLIAGMVPPDRVWIMPEGVTAAAVLGHAAAIEDAALDYGFNLTLRQHVLLHGTERNR